MRVADQGFSLFLAALFLGTLALTFPSHAVAEPARPSEEWTAGDEQRRWRSAEALLPQTRQDLRMELVREPRRPMFLTLLGEAENGQSIMRLSLQRDAEGLQIQTQVQYPDSAERSGWKNHGERVTVSFWPQERDRRSLDPLLADGISPRSWADQPLFVRFEYQAGRLHLWLQGRLVASFSTPAEAEGAASALRLQIDAQPGDRIGSVQTRRLPGSGRFMSLDLLPQLAQAATAPPKRSLREFEGVPYELLDGGEQRLDLSQARWIDAERDPGSYYERYDSGPYFVSDPRMPFFQLPRADYVAAHVLAVTEGEPNEVTPRFTLRIGRYNNAQRGQVYRHDFTGEVPLASVDRFAGTSLSSGPLHQVSVPLSTAFSQDLIHEIMDVEITRELRLARRQPDPNRFRWRALGLPSGVRIAAITFEKSPLQMQVTSPEAGHLFLDTAQPAFLVYLTNITDQPQPFRLTATATPLEQAPLPIREESGSVAPGETRAVSLAFSSPRRGYHDLRIELSSGERHLLTRSTSFVILPNVQRVHHEQSPFGVWDFTGGHLTPDDPDFVGPLYQKLGIRYGMFHHQAEDRQRWGVRRGNEFSLRTRHSAEEMIERYEKLREQHPDQLPHLLLFHEDSISGPHVTRVPDLFHDRPPYRLDEQEKTRFEEMFELARAGAQGMRAYDPTVHISLGNGPLPLREEFYRHGFPAELFDAAGNEAGVFGRLPERQPPDIVANNASIWMDRQLLDHYGYGEKVVTQCYEITYPGTNPGNLSEETQAAYFLRHLLHGLAWEMPILRVGSLTDMGNSYYFSNWGSSGFFRSHPEVSPKPAAAALSTLTWLMDGATFERKIDLGSDSLYGLLFKRADGERVLALWTVRGRRPVDIVLRKGRQVRWIDAQGNVAEVRPQRGEVTLTLSGMPGFLRFTGDVRSAAPGEPIYETAPALSARRQPLAGLSSLKGWRVVRERNPLLEAYNPMEPRRQGRFLFEEDVRFGDRSGLRVTPQRLESGKPTMPMVVELEHETGIELAGEPTELGLEVHGNSGWGRIIYELVDASGQRWISIGARGGTGNPWLADWLPPEMLSHYDPSQSADWNTNDVYGLSHINFDGWRYLAVPLPGAYPGEDCYPWPANSQWYSDGDGRVVYPLTLKKVMVQLNEKMLHVQDFQEPREQSIGLGHLMAVDHGPVGMKLNSGSYSHHVQVDGLR